MSDAYSTPSEPSTPPPSSSVNDALGIDDSKLKEVTGKMADNQRDKIAASDKIYGEVDATQKRLLPKIEELAKNAGVEATKMKPWNADEEAAKRRTDPIAAFGSFGSVFGILASAFTHAPMENALNASAAAMNAIHEGDKTSYDRAEKAWMENNKLALERQRIQHEAYQDAVSLLNVNMAAADTKLKITAARFGDKQMLALLDAGMSKEVQELIDSRQRSALALAEATPKIVAANAEMSHLFSLGYDPKNAQSQQSQEAYKKYKQEQVDLKQAERAYTPEQQAYAQFIKEKPDATAEERADYIQALRTRKKDLTPEQEAVNTFIEQHPDATADEMKAFVVDLRAKSRGTGLSREATITDDDAKRMAQQYVAGDKSVRQNISRGVTGPANITKLDHFVSEELKAQGITGKDLAVRLAEYHGLVAGESALGRRTAGVEMFANEAYNTMQIAQDISHQFPRTEFPAINKAVMAWQKGTGDPKAVEMGAAVNAVINTYAKAIAGGQQATVSDKDHAREVLEAAFTQTQFDAALSILKREIEAARKAPGQVKQEFRDLAGAGPAIAADKVPAAPNTIRYDKEGNRISQ